MCVGSESACCKADATNIILQYSVKFLQLFDKVKTPNWGVSVFHNKNFASWRLCV
jgi:hypothetical protein